MHRTTRGRIARGTREHRTKRGGQEIEDSEITIYDISRYRRKEKEDRKKINARGVSSGVGVNKP